MEHSAGDLDCPITRVMGAHANHPNALSIPDCTDAAEATAASDLVNDLLTTAGMDRVTSAMGGSPYRDLSGGDSTYFVPIFKDREEAVSCENVNSGGTWVNG